MATITKLTAQLRDRAGKGAARAVRRAGRVPAVIYGNKETPIMIELEPVELMKQIRTRVFFSSVCEVTIDGKTHRLLPRDIQLHPVTDAFMHLDLMRFSKKTKITVEAPVTYINEDTCVGIKAGGVLNVVRHVIEVRCSPDNIPEGLELDLTPFEVGESIHVSALGLSDDIELVISDRDFTMASISAPTVLVDVDPTDEEVSGETTEGAAAQEAEAEAAAEEK